MKQFPKKLTKETIYIIIFSLAFLSLQLVFNIKSLIFVFVIFFTICFFLLKFSLEHSLFFVLILSFSFEKGLRGWNVPEVAQGREIWMAPYYFYYGVSLRLITILTLFLLKIPNILDFFSLKKNFAVYKILFILVLFILLSFISTINSSDYFTSLFGFLRLIQAGMLFFVAFIMVKGKFTNFVILSLVIILLFNGLVSIRQYFNQGPLGQFLEDAVRENGLGFYTSDGQEKYYRSAGYVGHPTFFASYMSMLFAVSFGIFVHYFKNNNSKYYKYVALFSLLVGGVSVFTTFSRSAWVSILLTALIILTIHYIHKRKNSLRKTFQATNKKTSALVLALIFLLVLFGQKIVVRLASIVDILSTGSGVVRIALIKQSLMMIKSFPIWGTGLNLSVRMMNEQSILPSELRGFMFPVHNTFLLFFAELGIPAGILFILLIILVLFYSYKFAKKDFRILGLWLGVWAFILNAQFHTLFNQDPSFDLLFLFLGMLTSLCLIKRKSQLR